MIPPDHDICASTDHRHWTFSVHYCPHRQQWSLSRSAWLEQGTDDDPTEYSVETAYLGPFDGAQKVSQLLKSWIDAVEADAWNSPPRLPGSLAKSPPLSRE